jgi:hypothetical protein
MNRESVDSSNIASIGHDTESETLEIEFNNGSIYQYFDVPEQVYDDMMMADSKGRFLHLNIKGNFRYSKV